MNNIGFLCGSLSQYKFLDYSGIFEKNEPLILTYSPTVGTSSPFSSSTTYTNCIVDWGDGEIVEYGSELATHTFESEDDVTIRVVFEGLTSLSIMNNSKETLDRSRLKKIDGVLNGCENLTDLNYLCYDASNLTYLSKDLFKNCINVESACGMFIDTFLSEYPDLPPNLKDGTGMFDGCTNLTKIQAITCPLENMDYMFKSSGLIEPPNIPTTVKYLDYTFENTKIETMPYMENSIVETMDYTFSNCTNLTYTTKIPNTVTSMKNTFTDCTKLIAFTNFSNNLEDMTNTFIGCTSLVVVPEIPSSVKYLNGTFSGCSSLKEMPKLNEGITSMIESFKKCISIVETKEIPSTVKTFAGTFYGCDNLERIANFPQNATNMEMAYENCSLLYELPDELPETVINLSRCFMFCTHIVIAPKITGNPEDLSFMFASCERLEYLSNESLPESVTNISSMCQNCYTLQEVPYVLHSGLTNISYAFVNCHSATNAFITILCNITDEEMLKECFGGYGLYNSDDQITTLMYVDEAGYQTALLLSEQSTHVEIGTA